MIAQDQQSVAIVDYVQLEKLSFNLSKLCESLCGDIDSDSIAESDEKQNKEFLIGVKEE